MARENFHARSLALQVIQGSENLRCDGARPVLTIGNFDGVHRGHQRIMQTVIERAALHATKSVVLTFDPHPRVFFQRGNVPKLLMTLEQKLEFLERCGVDFVIVEPFSQSYADMPPEIFVKQVIWERIRPCEVYVGYDFHFGRDRTGSMQTLTELGPRLGFAVTIISEVQIDASDVSSTRVRELLSVGDAAQAAVLLGRPYGVRGRVVRGAQQGRILGFPTLNLAPENAVLPAPGVYAGFVRFLVSDPGVPSTRSLSGAGDRLLDETFKSVVNIGYRPTLQQSSQLVIEAHLFDFDADVYGRRIEIGFVDRLRDERKFPNADALKHQIALDAAEARRRLAKCGDLADGAHCARWFAPCD